MSFRATVSSNLKAAQKLGMQTIREFPMNTSYNPGCSSYTWVLEVSINGSLPALEQLGQKLKLDLISGNNGSASVIGTKL